MEVEELLRERLRAGSAPPLPSQGFEDRVRASLAPRRGRRPFVAWFEFAVALAAVVAITVAALPWLFGSHPGPVGPSAGTPVAATDASPTATHAATPTPAPSRSAEPVTHTQLWFLSFDYPSSWSAIDRGMIESKLGLNTSSAGEGTPAILGFLGTRAPTVSCPETIDAQGIHRFPCTTHWNLTDGSIVVRVSVATARDSLINPYIWTAERAVKGRAMPGAESITVGGLPARFIRSTNGRVPYTDEAIEGADTVLWWGLPSQRWLQQGWSIVAAIKGPDGDRLEAQARALVESIHFVPEPTFLPTDAADLQIASRAALKTFIASEREYADDEHDRAFDCFPETPGTSRQATITQTPNTNPLTKPLPVTCSVDVGPNVMQGWTITLTQSWKAGADYPAGSATIRYQTRPTGEGILSEVVGGDPLDPLPYPHQGRSKYPG